MPAKRKKRPKTAKKKKKAKTGPGYTRRVGYYGDVLELKFHDVDVDDAAIAAGATIAQNSCNLIPQGTSEKERIGRKCVVRSINWRFNMVLPTTVTAAETTDTVRIILYLDKQTNGVVAGTTDILEAADYQSFNNLANKGRFRTLMDRTYTLTCGAGSGRGTTDTLSYAAASENDTFFKNVNIPLEFDSTAGAITELKSNNIGVMTLGKSGHVVFDSKMRVRFEG